MMSQCLVAKLFKGNFEKEPCKNEYKVVLLIRSYDLIIAPSVFGMHRRLKSLVSTGGFTSDQLCCFVSPGARHGIS